MALRVRPLTTEEMETVRRLAQSRTEAARMVERARIIWQAHQGKRVSAIAQEVGVAAGTVRLWLKRFNTSGVGGLHDEPRSGCPPTYTPEQVGDVIATALTNPSCLGLPFGCWTLDRLEAYLNEEKGIAIKRSRIDDLLIAEVLRWRRQETWFSEQAVVEHRPPAEAFATDTGRVDPDFAAKRGPSSASTRRRPQAASS
jgi:transposase